MNLKYKNYIAYSEGDRFNLYEIKEMVAQKETKNHSIGDKYNSEMLIGYGYTYDGLVRRIASQELNNMEITLELGEYVSAFSDVLNEIKF